MGKTGEIYFNSTAEQLSLKLMDHLMGLGNDPDGSESLAQAALPS
jgi:hypothetical protein